MMELTPDSIVAISPDAMFRDLQGEGVILNLRTGIYFGLDPVGTRFWTLLGKHARLGTIHALMLDQYDVTPEQLWDDLVRLVSDMQRHGLVQIHASEDNQGR